MTGEQDTQRSGAGPAGQDQAARDRLAREARETAATLLDWVGTRVESVHEPGAGRPRQSAGPCTWCPVCALVAALRGEQPELTATLAEQASGLLVLLRLLVQSHAAGAHDHHHSPTTPSDPTPPGWPTEWGTPGWAAAPEEPAGETAGSWEVPAHAVFDPTPAVGLPVTPDAPGIPDAPGTPDDLRPERPTGRRGPRPSPRRPAGTPPAAETAPPPAASSSPAAPIPPAAQTIRATPAPAPVSGTRTRPGVQRIPVRRRPRPC